MDKLAWVNGFWARMEAFSQKCGNLYDRVIERFLYYALLLGAVGHLQFIITKWPQRLLKYDGQEVLSLISGGLFLYGAHVLNQETRKKRLS